jgi:tRNA(Arg) A34 adenosine deaminase TadA
MPVFPDAANGYMASALAAARRALLAGEPPIGASLVRGGTLLATCATSVVGSVDITAHAEINVIREATARLRCLTLEGAELYVTVEPCPMCIGACHYAGIERIFFGASIADLHALTHHEFTARLAPTAQLPEMRGGIMRRESLDLLDAWCVAMERR